MTQNRISTDTVEQFVARMSARYDIANDKDLVAVMSASDVVNANVAPKTAVAEPKKEKTFKIQ